MKAIKEQGVTYYIVGNDYDGENKDILQKFINWGTLFVNDITIMYDWANGLYLVEDQETGQSQNTRQMPALILTKILSDDGVIEWMHRNSEEDSLYEQ